MKRRNTMTAAVFLLAVSAGFLLLATSFFGGEGKFEALLKTFLRERDVMAFVDGAETAVNGEIVIALIGDEATCKRYSRKNGHVWLLPENDDYQPIDGTFARILGKVVGLQRRY